MDLNRPVKLRFIKGRITGALIVLLFISACYRDGGNVGPNFINIPDDFPSIQEGINASENGDIILVSPGIYYENLHWENKYITLTSWFVDDQDPHYIDRTVVDGMGQNVISVGFGSDDSTIKGLTIQNGDDGISVRSSISIIDNNIINNRDGLDYEGGGGECRRNLFENNEDDGIDLDGPVDALIMDNIIRGNGDDGIEIRLHPYAGPVLQILIQSNLISENLEDGIQLIDYDDLSSRLISIVRNSLYNNAMAGIGCMADGNTVEDFQGAPILERIMLVNNTISGNNYGHTGGANLVALNNIFVGNNSVGLKDVTVGSIASYNLFWNNGMDYENSNIDPDGINIFGKNPLLKSDYTLMTNSPAIDAGSSYFLWKGECVLDMSPDSYVGSAPDIGFYEKY